MARVLIAEPTPELSELLARVVTRAGHEPVAYVGAPSGAPADVDALLIEPAVPEADELATRLRSERPRLPIICVSIAAPTPEVLALAPVAFFEKPFSLKDVDDALHAVLAVPVAQSVFL